MVLRLLVSPLLAGPALLAALGAATLVGLLAADVVEARAPGVSLAARVAQAADRGDRLHYVVHLVLGRVLDQCTCTVSLANDQSRRAVAHARTGRQAALVTTERPTAFGARIADAVGILGSGVGWASSAGAWLFGRIAG